MKIFLYKNEDKGGDYLLSTALDDCISYNLDQREQELDGKAFVLESINKNKDLYEMEFTLRREDYGPGRSQKGQSTVDFDLGDNEGFGEQAAALYSPSHELVLVQYNHYGPRAKGMLDCLWHICHSQGGHYLDSRWNNVLDEATMARLAKGTIQKRLEVSIAGTGLSEVSHEAHNPLDSMLQLREQVNAGNLSLTLSLGKGRKGESLNLKNFIREIKKFMDSEDVVKLKARVGHEDSADEVIDFLGGRVQSEVDVDLLEKTNGRRYTFKSRIKVMKRELRKWVKQGYGS